MILFSLLCAFPSVQAPPRQVVVILADDMGQMSVGAYNDALGIPTPHLDQLAAEGMRFDDAHSPSAVCTPTRYALLTGRYAWRTRMKRGIVGRWQGALIAEERATLGGLLLDAGWRTDCVGKWHLGMDWRDASGAVTRSGGEVDWTQPILNGPTTRGFERYFGDDVPNWPPYVWIEDERALAVPSERMAADPSNGVSAGPLTPGWSLEAVLPALAERCAQTIAASAASDQPALLFFSMTSPHTPISPAV